MNCGSLIRFGSKGTSQSMVTSMSFAVAFSRVSWVVISRSTAPMLSSFQ